MNSDNILIKKYSISAVTYILNNLDSNIFNDIKEVILFGSVARGTATKESDIDIFFNTNKKNKNQILNKINEFYISSQGLLFKANGISNKIHAVVDKLENWKDLHKSISSEGITLYGAYSGKTPDGLEHYFLISWENLDIKNRGAFLNKVYGYSVGKTKYKGAIKKFGAKKIGKSALLLPAKYKQDFIEIMEKYKIGYRIIDFYSLF